MRTAIITPGSPEAKALGWDISEPIEAIQASAFLAPSERSPSAVDLWLPFADGRYRFALLGANTMQLERMFHRTRSDGMREDVGIGGIYQAIAKGRALALNGAPNWTALTAVDPDHADFSLFAVDMVIRLGLEGGGQGVVNGKAVQVDKWSASALIDQHFKERPIIERWTLAFAILGAALFGRAVD